MGFRESRVLSPQPEAVCFETGLGFRVGVLGSRFRVWGLGFRVRDWGLGFTVRDWGFRVWGQEFRGD